MRDLKDSSGIPLYFLIKKAIQDKIFSGEYKTDDKIPAETKLCTEYNVSRITVRKAIDLLVKENLLYTKQGVGTFVAHNKLIRELTKIYSFSEDMVKLGFNPSSKVVTFKVDVARPEEQEALKLPASNQRVYRITRVRLADGEPILLERTVIPHYLCRDLQSFNIKKDSLYRILKEDYRFTPYEAEETYEAAIIEPEEAELLQCRKKLAVFHIHRIGYLVDGTPFELTTATGRGDLLQFKLHLATNEANFSKHVGFKGRENST